MSKNDLSDIRMIEGVIAFRPEGRACSIYPLPELAPFPDDVRAFVAAGWAFAKAGGAQVEGQASVCVRDRRLMLLTGRLSVRFQKGVDADAASIAAARCGVELVRKSGVPDCWNGRVPDGKDLLAAVSKLSRHSDVVWAEPDLLEAIGHR